MRLLFPFFFLRSSLFTAHLGFLSVCVSFHASQSERWVTAMRLYCTLTSPVLCPHKYLAQAHSNRIQEHIWIVSVQSFVSSSVLVGRWVDGRGCGRGCGFGLVGGLAHRRMCVCIMCTCSHSHVTRVADQLDTRSRTHTRMNTHLHMPARTRTHAHRHTRTGCP